MQPLWVKNRQPTSKIIEKGFYPKFFKDNKNKDQTGYHKALFEGQQFQKLARRGLLTLFVAGAVYGCWPKEQEKDLTPTPKKPPNQQLPASKL